MVTHPHEGSFIRCNAGLINQMTPGRFSIAICGALRGIKALKQMIRHPDVSFVAFPDRLAGATERIRAAGCDLLNYWEVGTDTLNYFLPFARPVAGAMYLVGGPGDDRRAGDRLLRLQRPGGSPGSRCAL